MSSHPRMTAAEHRLYRPWRAPGRAEQRELTAAAMREQNKRLIRIREGLRRWHERRKEAV